MPKVRIAIAGAGMGGLAAAAALTRAGHEVRVHEQAAALGEVGVGMHLTPNGTRILQRWGLGDALRARAVRPEAMEVREWAGGTTLVRSPMGEAWTAEFGAPYYTVHRADLHALLLGLLPPGTVRVGRRLERFTDAEDGVRLEFADGSLDEADVLIGADGVHSAVRHALHGPGTPVFTGQSAFRGLVARRDVPHLPGDTVLVWAGPDARMLLYPVRGGEQLTFVALVPGGAEPLESWSAPGDLAALAAAFTGWNPDVTALVAAVRQARRWDLHDREPLASWGHGAVTLLGDAAHPMLPHHGQGVGQAVEDAAVLAHFLGAPHPSPARAGTRRGRIAEALRRYEAVRRPHTTRVQLGSRDGGSQRLRPAADGAAPRDSMASLVQDVSWIQRHDAEADLTETAVPAGAPA
ncbi:FAD-dependent monooxygenase [Streptomyces sp. NPDC085932]|uniref:FAD-dependent monooxygenase n=1 Tax=Streptomyces sp. NPDC085932 TaxID=3365741 RepID=UPI0037D0454A